MHKTNFDLFLKGVQNTYKGKLKLPNKFKNIIHFFLPLFKRKFQNTMP